VKSKLIELIELASSCASCGGALLFLLGLTGSVPALLDVIVNELRGANPSDKAYFLSLLIGFVPMTVAGGLAWRVGLLIVPGGMRDSDRRKVKGMLAGIGALLAASVIAFAYSYVWQCTIAWWAWLGGHFVGR
jgi:hypothetical protein